MTIFSRLDLLDVVAMQKYLVNAGTLAAGDGCEDGTLDIYDPAVMKRMVLA